MAFYSYVILLLTHIGIGAVAHGGDGQRRALILSKRAPKRIEPVVPSPLQPGCLSSQGSHSSPLASSLASFFPTGKETGLLDPITALTYHPSTRDP